MLCLPASGAERTLAQFVHRSWLAKDGAPTSIAAITQTTDGYLWLASDPGLYRFDGVEFERYQPQGQPLTAGPVYTLLSCPNGDLWIGSAVSGISLIRDGVNRNYGKPDGFPDRPVLSIAQDGGGAVWAATQAGLFRFDGAKWSEVGLESGFSGSPISLYVDRHGTTWAATIDSIYYLPKGERSFRKTGLQTNWVMQMLEAPAGEIWMAETGRSVRRMPPSDRDAEIAVGSQRILFDGDGALWITTLGDGLRRVAHPERLTHEKLDKSSGQLDQFTARVGLSSDNVRAIFNDREGNIWVGTSRGLDRFAKGAVIPGPDAAGSLVRSAMAPDANGDVWFGDLSGHVGRIHANQWSSARGGFVCFSAVADPIAGVWLTEYRRIYHEFQDHSTRIEYPDSYRENHQPVRIAIDHSGALWIFGSYGVYVRRGGEWTPVGLPPGFAEKTPSVAYADAAGRVWLGFKEEALVIIDGAGQHVLSEKDGLHGSVLAIFVRDSTTWIAGSKGLQLLDGQRLRDIAPAGGVPFGSVSGVLETSDGNLWLNAYSGIIHIAPLQVAKLRAGASTTEYSLFDVNDGLPGATQQTQPFPTVIQARDGKIWFATSSGPVWIDPQDLPRNNLRPPIAIRSITAGGKRYTSFAGLRLPKLTRDLDIDYTALSLTVPERVRFRYMLEGSDEKWHDAVSHRQACYTNLGPGAYRFRVMASNNDGVWNEAGASASFRIDAALYQTTWFQAGCFSAGLILLWLGYRYRLQQATAQANSRLEGQIAERERIARELHDTLLQSFQGLMLRLQVLGDLLPPGKAKAQLELSLERADQAIADGRRAVYGLRATDGDLAETLRNSVGECAGSGAASFRLVVEGATRKIHPSLCNEIARIASEALRNAFRHAQARNIETEISFGERHLCLRIRDDGVGMPAAILAEGNPGHYGLRGMRKRARQIGANLEIWSSEGRGVEIELMVPASIAYPDSSRRFLPFRRKKAPGA